jgi:hypothetical protein
LAEKRKSDLVAARATERKPLPFDQCGFMHEAVLTVVDLINARHLNEVSWLINVYRQKTTPFFSMAEAPRM